MNRIVFFFLCPGDFVIQIDLAPVDTNVKNEIVIAINIENEIFG